MNLFESVNKAFEKRYGVLNEAEDQPKDSPAENKNDAEEIIAKLKDADYEQFVKILNKDGKSKEFLTYLRNHYKLGDDSIKTIKKSGASEGQISCDKLKPTQQNISLSKSLGMISKPGWSEKIINQPLEAFDNPTVTYAGKYIIDGHHRWSKAYALNGGDCKIKVLNFPAIEGVNWEDMLKATQLAIVNSNPSASLVNEVGNDNMLKSSKEEIENFYKDNACDAVVEAMKKKGRGDTKEEQAVTVGDNVEEMKKTSQPVAGAEPRSVMPQTDLAPGSLDKLSTAVIDLTEAKELSDIEGTIGKLLKDNKDKFDKSTTKSDLVDVAKEVLRYSTNKDKPKFLEVLSKKKDYFSALKYIYDYILKGDGQGVIKIEENIGSELSNYQEYVDYDMKHFGKISAKTMSILKKNGLTVIRDEEAGEWEVIAKTPDHK